MTRGSHVDSPQVPDRQGLGEVSSHFRPLWAYFHHSELMTGMPGAS